MKCVRMHELLNGYTCAWYVMCYESAMSPTHETRQNAQRNLPCPDKTPSTFSDNVVQSNSRILRRLSLRLTIVHLPFVLVFPWFQPLHHCHRFHQERLELDQFKRREIGHLISAAFQAIEISPTCRYVPCMTPSLCNPDRTFACLTSRRSFRRDRIVEGETRSSDALSISAILVKDTPNNLPVVGSVQRHLGVSFRTHMSRRTLDISINLLGKCMNPSAFSFSSFSSSCSFSASQKSSGHSFGQSPLRNGVLGGS